MWIKIDCNGKEIELELNINRSFVSLLKKDKKPIIRKALDCKQWTCKRMTKEECLVDKYFLILDEDRVIKLEGEQI